MNTTNTTNANPRDSIREFSRISWAGLLGLNVVTLGLGMLWWLPKQSRAMNRAGGSIPGPVVFLYMATVLVSTILFPFVLLDKQSETSTVGVVRTLCSLAEIILGLMLAFNFRSDLDRLATQLGIPLRQGGGMTFFFNLLYNQYKIVELCEAADRAPISPPAANVEQVMVAQEGLVDPGNPYAVALPQSGGEIRPAEPTVNREGDSIGFGMRILCFLMPIVSIIMYFVWRKNWPGKAQGAMRSGLAGFAVGMVLKFIGQALSH